jgi:hypothetical protein
MMMGKKPLGEKLKREKIVVAVAAAEEDLSREE